MIDRTFLLIGALTAFLGVALGAFGAHALGSRLAPERLALVETGVRYQLWHSLALFAVAFVDVATDPSRLLPAPVAPLVLIQRSPAASIAGWLFVAGIVLFSGSLYALALTGRRRWGAITPLGGACLLLGWLALAWAAYAL